MVTRVAHHESSTCPVACSLDIFGDHWTLLVIRELMFTGNHQFKDMLTMPEGISSNILSDRLWKLEGNGVVASAYKPGSRRDKLYYLTAKGKGLVYALLEISRWADLNLGERVYIPEERRPFLEKPLKDAARIVFKRLEAWEKENLETSGGNS